ncbi:MAG: hypothetical protein ACPL4H_10670, partial [Anaerolineales bacterium]
MSTRPFDWRDIAALYRYRKDCIYLNSAWLLTRGRLSLPSAMLSTFSLTSDVFTAVHIPDDHKQPPLIGQVMVSPVPHLAQLTFLMPERAIKGNALNLLLEYLT